MHNWCGSGAVPCVPWAVVDPPARDACLVEYANFLHPLSDSNDFKLLYLHEKPGAQLARAGNYTQPPKSEGKGAQHLIQRYQGRNPTEVPSAARTAATRGTPSNSF